MAEVYRLSTSNSATTGDGYRERYGNAETQYDESIDDGAEKAALKRKLVDWWSQARAIHATNRQEQAIDCDFKDGIQWRDEDRQAIESRGQVASVFNEIHSVIEWIIGTEKRTRIDWAVKPRTSDDVELAHVKTQVLKYISDVNKLPFQRSRAFADLATAGVGWLELGIRPDAEDEMLFVRAEKWRNMWLDPLSVELDISDARYLFRSKVLDLDIACAMFPQHEQKIKLESDSFERFPWQEIDDINYNTQVYYDYGRYSNALVNGLVETYRQRKVIRLIEAWYREPARVQVIRSSTLRNEIFDPADPLMQQQLDSGYATLFDGVRMQVKCAIMTQSGTILHDANSPYRHNRFPFVPIFAYRKDRDNMPYSAIRHMRDPQMDLNKRRSKALFLLSTNKVIIDRDAVEDPELFEEEAARPDQIVWTRPQARVEFINNLQLADAHIQYGMQDAEYIRQVSGVTGENLGLDTNAESGRAILAKQDQGGVVTTSLFDSLRLGTQLAGEIMLSLVEQYYTEERVIRLVEKMPTNKIPQGMMMQAQAQGRAMPDPNFMPINQPQQDGSMLNDITASRADFVVDEQDFRQSIRQAMFESLMQVIANQPPEIAIRLLDLAFEQQDLPNKDEIVKRIRQISGVTNPDDPEAEAAAQQQAQMEAQKQQQLQDLEMQRIQLELQKIQAEIQRIMSQAQRDATQAQRDQAGIQRDLAGAEKDAALARKEAVETALVERVLSQNLDQDEIVAKQSVDAALGVTPGETMPDGGIPGLSIRINT